MHSDADVLRSLPVLVARNFSCYPFESLNAILSRMRKATRKQGAVEDSLMRMAVMRTEVARAV